MASEVIQYPRFASNLRGKVSSNPTPQTMGIQRTHAGTPLDFYDQFAPYYHLIFPDWDQSITRQAVALDAIIKEYVDHPVTILDASCGIGTQSLGLYQLGYTVDASDLSAASITRARVEAVQRKCAITFAVADMRALTACWQLQYDVVLACDNAIPHLLSDADILAAFEQLYACTKTGGITLISVRDYDVNPPKDGAIKQYAVQEVDGIRYIIFQVWSVAGPVYELSMYVVQDNPMAGIKTEVLRTHYYAIKTNQLATLMTTAGFEDVRVIKDAYYQPVLVGQKTC